MNRRRLVILGAVGALGLYSPAGAWTRQQLASIISGPRVAAFHVSWQGVDGATGYEVAINGQVVDRVNRNARDFEVVAGQSTLVEITDLPDRSLVQAIDFQQTEA